MSETREQYRSPKRWLLAIDPGASGGLAYRDLDGLVLAEAMPAGMTAIVDRLRTLQIEIGPLTAVIEKVGGYMPGNSGPAAAKFARHCGHLEAACYALGIAELANQPTPQKWQAALGSLPKDKPERKRAIREAMQRAHPHLRVTLKTADALGLLAWGEGQG